jgi:hypothetical protein
VHRAANPALLILLLSGLLPTEPREAESVEAITFFFLFYHQRLYPEKVYCIQPARFVSERSVKEQIKASLSSSYTAIMTNSQKKAL